MSRQALSRIAVCLTLIIAAHSTQYADGADGQPASAPTARLALPLRRGISLDRQFRQIPPEPIMRFTREDIRLIKSSGFEFVKLIVNPEPLMNGEHLDAQKREYLREIVAQVVDEGLPVVVCLHPEWEFKKRILGEQTAFAEFLVFLQEVSQFLAERWTPQQLVLQLMTEPVTDKIPWNELQPQMWHVARKAMPGHTLVLAGDQVGKIEGLITTQPVDDANVLYSFTFYDPFLFTLQGAEWLTPGWWGQLGPVPYPSSPEIMAANKSAILDKISADPPSWRVDVAGHLEGYGAQRWNSETLTARIALLDQWNRSHGGGLKIWCAEFGCYQQTVRPEDRYQYLRDVRTAFERFNIGWAYWSYNETLTMMSEPRQPFGPAAKQTPDPQLLKALLDRP
jgi:endoglucanase